MQQQVHLATATTQPLQQQLDLCSNTFTVTTTTTPLQQPVQYTITASFYPDMSRLVFCQQSQMTFFFTKYVGREKTNFLCSCQHFRKKLEPCLISKFQFAMLNFNEKKLSHVGTYFESKKETNQECPY